MKLAAALLFTALVWAFLHAVTPDGDCPRGSVSAAGIAWCAG